MTVAPRYRAGALHRAMLGSGYRSLWTTPITVEELDLAHEAGGLRPVRRVGGQQTKGLALAGQDGHSYTFRGLDKDPATILPDELQDTFVEDLVRDQMAAQHPAGALVADELARAAGVPTLPVRLVVMPDDPALGEFRREFAGLVGTFAEYPTTASRGDALPPIQEIVGHEALYAKLAASPDERVDTRAFLRARLFDLLISDFDRHRKQWRWARTGGDTAWLPIPEDRDQAFARYEGLLVRAASRYVPQIRRYGARYDRIFGLTYNGREQDRWLLPALSHDVWMEEARAMASRLGDEDIERAARRMPPEWYAIDGARLAKALVRRRDTLPAAAEAYYRHLAGQVDVQATNADDAARVTHRPDGSVLVELQPRGFRRVFVPDETDEVRLYMHGGDDRVEVSGEDEPRIVVRAIGGPGDDRLVDHGKGRTRYYDSEGANELQGGPGTLWDRRPYTPPAGPKAAPWIPPRDWGRDWFPLPWLSYGSDTGVFAGAGFTTVGYGFRQRPYADRHTLRAGWAFAARQPRLEYEGIFRARNSGLRAGLVASASGLEVLRFYGFGNETSAEGPDAFYKVHQKQIAFSPTLSVPLADALELTLAPTVRYASTAEGERLVDALRPYGSDEFGQLGGWVRIRLDTRRATATGTASAVGLRGGFGPAGYPQAGMLVEATAAVFPKAWDVERAYGWVDGSASTYLSSGRRATLALRAGGRHMLGERYPFHDAATLGGGNMLSGQDTLRGFRPNRFIGDRSVYGNAELRLFLSRFFVALPGEWGLFAFGDAGRVWLEGEESDRLHTSWGGGAWVGVLSRANAVAFTVGQSEERTTFTVRAGFSF